MLPELRALVDDRRRRLRLHVEQHSDFMAELLRPDRIPTLVEREATGMMLHSFYMGVESVMRSISDGIDGARHGSAASWHASLLESMVQAAQHRPPVLLPSTASALVPYLRFRHRFRNLYGAELEWALMRPLVAAMNSTFAAFDADLTAFMAPLDRDQPAS